MYIKSKLSHRNYLWLRIIPLTHSVSHFFHTDIVTCSILLCYLQLLMNKDIHI